MYANFGIKFIEKQSATNKIKHEVLNAKFHEQEAKIIANAGEPSAVTIATNMAGRGTDIQLGGNLDFAKSNEKNSDSSTQIEEKIKESKKKVSFAN